jgi:hypothetical protein
VVEFSNIDGWNYMIISKKRGILIIDVDTNNVVVLENEDEFLFGDEYGIYSSEL